MAEILITKPGVLNAADKAALRKAGIVPITAKEPSEVRFIRAEQELDGGDLALAAMKALSKSSGMHNEHLLFVKLIGEALAERKPSSAMKPTDTTSGEA